MESSDKTSPVIERYLSGSYVLESIQVIYSEIRKEYFFVNVIKVLADISRAYRVILYSVNDKHLCIEAENFPGTSEWNNRMAIDTALLPEDRRNDYFLSVIKDVIQAREPVSIEDSVKSKAYLSDAYIARKKPGAILCLPLFHNTDFTGVLYFEFDRKGIFSNELIEVLFTIARHIGIAFDHTQKYHTEIMNRNIRKAFLNALFGKDLGIPAEKVIDSIAENFSSEEGVDWADVLNSIKAEEWYWEYMSKIVMLKIKNEELKRSLTKAENFSRKKTESLVNMGNEMKVTLNSIGQMLETITGKGGHADKLKIVRSIHLEIDALKDFINDAFRNVEIKPDTDNYMGGGKPGVNGMGSNKILENDGMKRLSENHHRNGSVYSSIFDGDIPMDYDQAIIEFEGSELFLIEVMEGFIENVDHQLDIIRRSVENEDFETVLQEANSIKGGADNLTAWDLAEASRELIAMVRLGNLERVHELVHLLEKEFHRLKNFAIRKSQLNVEE